jgi:ectoine hydroxylase-related dioxygenase (phytanoyl-CoA dioxygenase family)
MYKFHKDKWYRKNTIYSDIQIENIFLPFTNAFDSNSIWTESVEDQHDFSPIKCDYGQFVHWDGNNLLHGNVINKSGNSRVSIDFRVYKYENLLHPDYTLLNF